MSMVISGDNGLTFPAGSTQVQAGNYQTMVNRIINGRMEIDQRNAGASVTAGNAYTLDRWLVRTDTGTGNTTQQSTTAPTGYKNSLIVTVGTGATPASGGRNYIQQVIEGFNVADLAWGTASASTVTLSFWVRSSLTGTFGGALQNSAGDRSYPFTYVINSANTFEYKTVTIAGDTTGTWLTTNGAGILLYIGLGNGSTFNGTAGAWAASDFRGATGSTNVVATSGATFYITGVDLRVGSYTVVPQDFRAYGTELALCQRYYAKLQNDGSGSDLPYGIGLQINTTTSTIYFNFPVTMRSEPSASISNVAVSDFANFTNDATLGSVNCGYNTAGLGFSHATAGAGQRPIFLTVKNNTSGFVAFSSEL